MLGRGLLGRLVTDVPTSTQLSRSLCQSALPHNLPLRSQYLANGAFLSFRDRRPYGSAASKVSTTIQKRAATTKNPATKTPTQAKATKVTPRKKAAPKRKPAAKKPAARKAAPKRKAAVKRPARKRKVLTEEQKAKKKDAAAQIKAKATLAQLKQTALVEPKLLPATAYLVFHTENASKGASVTSTAKETATKYRALTPAELEHYNHLANQNKAANERTYRAWVNSYTPEQIRQANVARVQLKRKAKESGKGKIQGHGRSPIHDDRLVKRASTSYALFNKERHQSGDLKHIPLSEASKLIAGEWKALSASEKKQYADTIAEDRTRYEREFKSVYGHEVGTKAATAQD